MAEKSLKKNTFFYTLKMILGIIFPIITFPYASRVLLPSGIGRINFVNSIIDYFVLFAGLGITAYAIRESSKVKNDKILFSKFATEIIIINLFTTIISYTLLFLTLIFSSKLKDYKILLLLGSSKILLTTFGLEWVYKTQEEFKYIAKRTFIFQIISISFLFIFIHSPEDINFYMIFTVLSSAGANICNIIYARKFIRINFKIKLEIKKHIKPVLILFASDIATSVFTILDTTMLGFIKSDSEVGYYSAAMKISKMLILTLSAIIGVLLPRLSYLLENDKIKYNSLLNKGSNILQAISIPIVFGLVILAKPLIILFCGKNYISSIFCMQILSPLVFIILFNSFFSDLVFLTHKKDLYIVYPVICAAIINFIMNLVLIPKYSITGAAIASVTAELIILLIKVILTKKIISNNIKLIFSKLYQYIVSSIIMSILIKFILLKLPENNISLFITIFAGILIYGFLLIYIEQVLFQILLLSK